MEEKTCSNCKYTSASCYEKPCIDCFSKSNWVEGSIKGTTFNSTVPAGEFKTGDIVTVEYSKDVYVYLCDNLIINIHADITIDPPEVIAITENIKEPSVTCKYRIVASIDILSTKTNYFLKFAGPVAMHRVHYATAADIMDHNANARKDHPVFLSDWINSKIIREEVNNMNKIKALNTPRDFKAGDLVVAKNDHRSVRNIYIYLGDDWVLHVPSYVLVRSKCDCCFSDYINDLISADIALHICNLDYASPKDITEHDRRANTCFIFETLNEWFSNLIKKELEKASYKVWTVKDPGLGYKDYGARYDKFPTFNRNFIKKVIFNDPATIVFWEDGTKTVVKTQDGEKYDKEKGLAMAISKKVFGNERDYYNVFKRWMRKGEERHE